LDTEGKEETALYRKIHISYALRKSGLPATEKRPGWRAPLKFDMTLGGNNSSEPSVVRSPEGGAYELYLGRVGGGKGRMEVKPEGESTIRRKA